MSQQRIELKMPDANNVGPSVTAIFKMPIGLKFHELQFPISGTAPVLTDISEIRVKLNSKIVMRFSATELDQMNQFDGRAAWHATNSPALILPFDRYKLENSIADAETAVDTGQIGDGAPAGARRISAFTVEMVLTSGFPADGDIKCYATQSASDNIGAGTVRHIYKDNRYLSGSGEFQIADMPYGGETTIALNRTFFIPSANNLTDMKVKRDNIDVFERTAALNEQVQTDGIRTPVSGVYGIDRTERGIAGNRLSLVGVRDFRYVLTTDGAMTVTILSDYMGNLGD